MGNDFIGMTHRQIADQLCSKSSQNCGWYHGNWHLLKSLGMVSTSAIHQESICRLLKKALNNRSSAEILLTGSSDESLLEIIRKSADTVNCNVQIAAVDICETPLIFMQQYADQHSLKLQTHCSDILEYKTDKAYDVILTHAFMGYFSEQNRPQLVSKWFELLADDGKVVTVQRIRSETSADVVRFEKQQAKEFMEHARECAKKSVLSEYDVNLVDQAANHFTSKFTNYSIRSRGEIESLFLNAGFAFNMLEYHRLEPLAKLSGPSVPSGAEFAHIIAEKRSLR